MSHHDTPCGHDAACNTDQAADSCYDAKSVIALVAIVVVTVCFWLVGK